VPRVPVAAPTCSAEMRIRLQDGAFESCLSDHRHVLETANGDFRTGGGQCSSGSRARAQLQKEGHG